MWVCGWKEKGERESEKVRIWQGEVKGKRERRRDGEAEKREER